MREGLTKDARAKKLEAYLKGLDKSAYLQFLRSVDKADGIFKGEEDKQLSMFFFARWYLESVGKDDNLLNNLTLIKDNTLPWRWRSALLDVLKPAQKRDLTMADVSAISKLFRDASKDKNQAENLRWSFIETNASMLLIQLELLGEKAPKFKQRIVARDKSILEEREIQSDQNLRTCVAALFGEAKKYEEHLQIICEEVKALKLQTRAKALLKEWRSQGNIPENTQPD